MSYLVLVCNICGNAVADPAKTCNGCEEAKAPATASSQAISVGVPVLSVRDFMALERFARLRLSPAGAVYAALIAKLELSCMLPVDAAVSGSASLGSRVVFSVDGGTAEERLLELPSRRPPALLTLSVTTPRGLALLGRAPGAVITAIRRDRTTETLRLIAVTYEPNDVAADDSVTTAEQTRTEAPVPSGQRRIHHGTPVRATRARTT